MTTRSRSEAKSMLKGKITNWVWVTNAQVNKANKTALELALVLLESATSDAWYIMYDIIWEMFVLDLLREEMRTPWIMVKTLLCMATTLLLSAVTYIVKAAHSYASEGVWLSRKTHGVSDIFVWVECYMSMLWWWSSFAQGKLLLCSAQVVAEKGSVWVLTLTWHGLTDATAQSATKMNTAATREEIERKITPNLELAFDKAQESAK